MTWIGFCDEAALSKNTSGLPRGFSCKMGKSARMRATSASDKLWTCGFASALILVHLDRDRIALHDDRIRLHGANRRQPRGAARGDVEARAVARALDLFADELTLVERPAIVRVLVLDRENRTVVVAQRDAPLTRFDHLDPAGGELSQLGDFDERGHRRVRFRARDAARIPPRGDASDARRRLCRARLGRNLRR